MPRRRPRVTQLRLFHKISDSIQEANRQGNRVEVIYLNALDLGLLTPGDTVNLMGVTLTVSRAVPPGHYCLKNDLEEVRHISPAECRPLL